MSNERKAESLERKARGQEARESASRLTGGVDASSIMIQERFLVFPGGFL